MFKKDELIETIKKEQKDKLEELRKEIRTRILNQKSYEDGGEGLKENTIYFSVCKYPKVVVKIVMEEYKNEGWKISINSSSCITIVI